MDAAVRARKSTGVGPDGDVQVYAQLSGPHVGWITVCSGRSGR